MPVLIRVSSSGLHVGRWMVAIRAVVPAIHRQPAEVVGVRAVCVPFWIYFRRSGLLHKLCRNQRAPKRPAKGWIFLQIGGKVFAEPENSRSGPLPGIALHPR